MLIHSIYHKTSKDQGFSRCLAFARIRLGLDRQHFTFSGDSTPAFMLIYRWSLPKGYRCRGCAGKTCFSHSAKHVLPWKRRREDDGGQEKVVERKGGKNDRIRNQRSLRTKESEKQAARYWCDLRSYAITKTNDSWWSCSCCRGISFTFLAALREMDSSFFRVPVRRLTFRARCLHVRTILVEDGVCNRFAWTFREISESAKHCFEFPSGCMVFPIIWDLRSEEAKEIVIAT